MAIPAILQHNANLRLDRNPLKEAYSAEFVWMDVIARFLQDQALFGGTRKRKHIWTMPDPLNESIWVLAIGVLETTDLPFTHRAPLDDWWTGDVAEPAAEQYPFYENRHSDFGYRLLVQDLALFMRSIGVSMDICLLDHQRGWRSQETFLQGACDETWFDAYHQDAESSYHETFREKTTLYFIAGAHGISVEIFPYQGIHPYGGTVLEPYPAPDIRPTMADLKALLEAPKTEQKKRSKTAASSGIHAVRPVFQCSEEKIKQAKAAIKQAYLAHDLLLIGVSGGKDSHTTLQLTCEMLQELKQEKQSLDTPVYCVSSNTLVENPRLEEHLLHLKRAVETWAKKADIPLVFKLVEPDFDQTFWVNVIGRNYPAPNKDFRWCVDRLKLLPSNAFLQTLAKRFSSGCLLLGTRTEESSERKKSIERHQTDDFYGIHPMAGVRTGMPIKDWTTEEVFAYLIDHPAPWQSEYSNLNLVDLYAEAQGECPLAIANVGTDAKGKTTMSNKCSGSRMGCYVCTLVTEDASLREMSRKQEGAYDGHLRIRQLLRDVSQVENGLRTGIQRVPKKANAFQEGYGEVHFEGAILLLEALLQEGLTLRPDECNAIEQEWKRRIRFGEIGVSERARQLLDAHRTGARWKHPDWYCDHCSATLTQKERRISRQSTHGHICLSCLGQELGHASPEETNAYVDLYICPTLSD